MKTYNVPENAKGKIPSESPEVNTKSFVIKDEKDNDIVFAVESIAMLPQSSNAEEWPWFNLSDVDNDAKIVVLQ